MEKKQYDKVQPERVLYKKYQHERVQHNIWNECNMKKYKIERILYLKKWIRAKVQHERIQPAKKFQNEMITIQEGAIGN